MFREGDRVVAIHAFDDFIRKGLTGTVTQISESYNYGVVWDEFMDGHTLGGTCEDGFGWWVVEDDIALLAEEDHEIAPDISDLL